MTRESCTTVVWCILWCIFGDRHMRRFNGDRSTGQKLFSMSSTPLTRLSSIGALGDVTQDVAPIYAPRVWASC